MSHITSLQSQQQLQLEQSCSVIVERCRKEQRFYSSPERNVRFRSSGRRRRSIPGPCSGRRKCSIAKCSSLCMWVDMSMLIRNGNDDVIRHPMSGGVFQPYYHGAMLSKQRYRQHINETGFARVPLANGGHGGVQISCMAENTSRAAALNTDCSRHCSVLVTPTRTELQ